MNETWLPLIFASIMGLALLMYVILDGYDLGIGILLPFASDTEKDEMLLSIGPFWDANETWIVLGVGILLIAFPSAHGIVLTALYIPATLMLVGLVLRGIAFDFRIKAETDQKYFWNMVFSAGSMLAAVCQGWMLGSYITGLQDTAVSHAFAVLVALSLPALYSMLACAWLLARRVTGLEGKAMKWARIAWLPMGFAFLLVSVATPLVSEMIADKWFRFPQFWYLFPIPLMAAVAYAATGWLIFKARETRSWRMFFLLVCLCMLASGGLAYSLFPDIIIGRMNLYDAAAAPESLAFTLWGTLLTLPFIIGYTFFVYRIFCLPESAVPTGSN
jgi:cytochrome d ubiquinol oxidase subunit II